MSSRKHAGPNLCRCNYQPAIFSKCKCQLFKKSKWYLIAGHHRQRNPVGKHTPHPSNWQRGQDQIYWHSCLSEQRHFHVSISTAVKLLKEAHSASRPLFLHHSPNANQALLGYCQYGHTCHFQFFSAHNTLRRHRNCQDTPLVFWRLTRLTMMPVGGRGLQTHTHQWRD